MLKILFKKIKKWETKLIISLKQNNKSSISYRIAKILRKKRQYTKKLKELWNNTKVFLIASSAEEAKYSLKQETELINQIKKPLKQSLIVIGIAMGFFIIWGSIAPLDRAVIAPGIIIVSTKTKTIQHLEGGLIEQILVKDGDTVEEGQPLIILSDVQDKARLQQIEIQLASLKALESRLITERDKKEEIDFSDPIFQNSNMEIQNIIKNQYDQFKSRQAILENKKTIYLQKIQQYEEKIKGLEAQHKSIRTQLEISSDELENMRVLFSKGLINKARLNQLLRLREELEGKNGEIAAEIANAKGAISQTEIEILNLEDDWQKEITAELKDTQVHIATLKKEYESQKDIVERKTIRSPNSGIVSNIQVFSVGAVISSGMKIMDIVPQHDELIIEAKVMPKDIEGIKPGMPAKIQLSAFKSRLVPRLSGEVIYVSADSSVTPAKPGEQPANYYTVRVQISQKELKRVRIDVELYPGMPAEVFIVKGTRTFLQYLLSPITESFYKAFKES